MKVAADGAYMNAVKNSDRQNARIELESALARVVTSMVNDEMEIFKQYSDNPGFKRSLLDWVFALTYDAQDGAVA